MKLYMKSIRCWLGRRTDLPGSSLRRRTEDNTVHMFIFLLIFVLLRNLYAMLPKTLNSSVQVLSAVCFLVFANPLHASETSELNLEKLRADS